MINRDKRFSVKTILVAAVSVLLLIAMSIGLVLAMPSRSINQKAEAATTDFTQATASEQVAVNNEIDKSWGNPTTTPTLLSGTITQSNINANTGNYWYYLNSDITANFADYNVASNAVRGNARIVLNGYSISGNFQIGALDSNSTVSIFDKIPNKSGTGYDYNPNPEKYYKFNSGTGGYTDYYTSVPSGTDVTSMPTFKSNTYIKVTGSAFSPNAQNSNVMTLWIGAYGGTLNMYGINVVGCQGIGATMIVTYYDGNLNLYQCTVIGNSGNSGAGAVGIYWSGTVNLNYCKVYGNSTTYSYGMQPSNPEIADKMYDVGCLLKTNQISTVNMYKSNVGVLSGDKRIKNISFKDVDFGARTVTIRLNDANNATNRDTFFQSFNDISGTIELGYSCTTTYTGNSPNLNFIVHGRDNQSTSNGQQLSGYNTLTLGSSAMVNTVVVSGTGQIENGATVSQVLHDGVNGRLIDKRQNPAIDRGNSTGFSSKVTVNNGANLDVLDIRAGGYLGMGSITNPTTPPTTDISTSNSITVSIASSVGGNFVYNGQPHTPPVTVTNNGQLLTQNTDYTVAYSNNINAGTATVTVTGKGNYTGTKTATFIINKAANPPTIPQGSIQVTQSGTQLSAYSNYLPQGWSWQNPNMAVTGNMTAVAVYYDTANYNNTTVTVSIIYNVVGPVLPPDNNTGGTVVVRNNSTGLIIAITVSIGLILLILIVLLVIFLMIKKSREEREREARVTEMKRQAAMQQALLQRQQMLDRQDMARESRQLGMRRPMPPSGTGGIGGAYGTRPTAQLPYRSNNYPPRDTRR